MDELLSWKGPATQWLEDNEEVIQRAYAEMLEEEVAVLWPELRCDPMKRKG